MDDMIIREVRVSPVRLPWVERPRLSASATTETRNLLIVEVETQGGIIGLGYLHLLSPVLDTVAACLVEAIIPQVVGRSATAVEAIWKTCWQRVYGAGRMGVVVMAMSAIDIALWDAIGKRAGLPLHRLWGHYRSEIPVYGSGCLRGLGREGMIEKARKLVSQGFAAVKMQVGHNPDRRVDLENVRQMREAIGPDIELMLDANRAWSAADAIRMGRAYQELDIYWLEEPVVAEDVDGYLRVAEALDIRIVGGESHFTRFDLRALMISGKIPIIQPDPIRGGLSECRKIATICDAWGVEIAPHLYHELSVHLLASIPNGSWLEYMGWLDDLWVEGVPVTNGVAVAPERPGHGLAFRPEVMAERSRS